MKEVIDTVLESMDENEFYTIFSWAAIKAILTMVVLCIIGFFILPTVAEGNTTLFLLTFIATFLVFSYIFKLNYHKITNVITYAIVSFIYGSITYLFGELIYIGLVAAGILIVVVFISGDASLTGIYTYRDLKKWVIARSEQERKKKEKEEADKDALFNVTKTIDNNP